MVWNVEMVPSELECPADALDELQLTREGVEILVVVIRIDDDAGVEIRAVLVWLVVTLVVRGDCCRIVEMVVFDPKLLWLRLVVMVVWLTEILLVVCERLPIWRVVDWMRVGCVPTRPLVDWRWVLPSRLVEVLSWRRLLPTLPEVRVWALVPKQVVRSTTLTRCPSDHPVVRVMVTFPWVVVRLVSLVWASARVGIETTTPRKVATSKGAIRRILVPPNRLISICLPICPCQ